MTMPTPSLSRHSSTTCGCHDSSFSSGSPERTSSQYPSAYMCTPKTKKRDHPCKRHVLPTMLDKPPSQQPHAKLECLGTPSSKYIASPRLPLRSPSMRSPAQRVSSSCLGPEMIDCVTRIGKLLAYAERCANAQTSKRSDSLRHAYNSCIGHNKINDAITVNNRLSGTVVVENKGEALIVHVKCPCGAGYEILLFGAATTS